MEDSAMQNNFRLCGVLKHRMRALAAATMCILGVLCMAPAYSASKAVLVLGDSLSAEYGLVRGTGWVTLLQKRLQAEKYDATVINASISGETTSGGRARLQTLLDKHHPDIVVIELGANDGLRGLDINAAQANLRAMITASQKIKARTLLIGMQIPPNYGADYTQRFSGIYPKLAGETATPLVPFLLQRVVDKPQWFQADRVHPTADAQSTMLENVWPHLKPLLAK
jgi:acyl-CoA thioesterase-1